MASHTSIGSSSSSRTRSRAFPLPHHVVCYHNEVAPLRVVRTCGFFKWLDEVDDVRELQQIIGEMRDCQIAELNAEKDELKEKIRRLKAKKEKLVDEVEEMGIATTETMFELKENKKDKRLMLALFFSWAFLTLVLFMK
ncbi:Rho GTPase-activating protein gacT [Bienertia sinuspersici]